MHKDKIKNSLIFLALKRLTLCSSMLLIFLLTTAEAKTCANPYDGNSLPYPSRQQLCPNGKNFKDFFTGIEYPCEQAHVDHVISRKMAYDLGICGQRLEQFSADKDNLRLTHSKINIEKSSKNPILYAHRHGDKAVEKVEDIVKKMSTKYPDAIGLDRMRNHAMAGSLKENRLLYKQKNTAIKAARLQQKTRKEIERRIGRKLINMLGRNSALAAAESTTMVLAGVALGSIAMDLYDTCAILTDLELLENDTEKVNDSIFSDDEKSICGMNMEQFLAFMGSDLELKACVQARISSNTIYPPECDGISDVSHEIIELSETIQPSIGDIPDFN